MNILQRTSASGEEAADVLEVLSRYPEKDRLSALTERFNKASHSALLMLSDNFDRMEILLKFFPVDMRAKLLMQKIGRKGNFPVTRCEFGPTVTKIHQLLFDSKLLPKDKVFEVLHTKDAQDLSCFDIFKSLRNTDIPSDFLPKDDHSKLTPKR